MTIDDIKNFIDGYGRYFLLNMNDSFLSPYLKRKFKERLEQGEECLMLGSCKSCGCKTPEVFMANKGCKLGCYKPMKPLTKRIKIIVEWKIRRLKRMTGL